MNYPASAGYESYSDKQTAPWRIPGRCFSAFDAAAAREGAAQGCVGIVTVRMIRTREVTGPRRTRRTGEVFRQIQGHAFHMSAELVAQGAELLLFLVSQAGGHLAGFPVAGYLLCGASR